MRSIPLSAAILLAFLGNSLSQSLSDPTKPFPENRVRDFYAGQAREMLEREKPWPPILPPFPGLDGGAWGHWGQNPESDNTDRRLNEMDFGGLLMQITRVGDRVIRKGINVEVDGWTAIFDPEALAFVAAWEGGFVRWSSRRYGITSGVTAAAKPAQGSLGATWELPAGVTKRYQGFHRQAGGVVFVYRIGEAQVYETLGREDGGLVRRLTVDGTLPEGAITRGGLPVRMGSEAKQLAEAGPPLWAGKEVVTSGVLGGPGGAFAIDTLTIPYRDENPFRTPMRIGGMDVLPGERVAVCTLMGDVWIVSGVDEDLNRLVWRRFASGLNQPLGLVADAETDTLCVIGRDQLTRLHDRNGDGEADFYECLTNEFPTAEGNSFALTLNRDSAGAFYWFTRSNRFGVTRYLPGAPPEAIATGLRGTNGMGVSPDGSIVFAMPQEGDWQPASGIFEVGDGSFHGHAGPRRGHGPHGYDMPLCFIPRGIDNSSGDIAFLPSDDRLGPLSARMIGTSFGYCEHYLVLREEVGDGVQGGVVPLPGEFLSGAHRLRFNPADGHIYVAGTDGWQSYARENGSLQRLRYTGGDLLLPRAVETRENGFIVRFDVEIDPASLADNRVFAQQWNYLYSAAYGSPEFSVKQPGTQGHDPVEVSSWHLIEDRRSVFIEIPQLHPVMQFHLYLELKTADGAPLVTDLYYSIFELGEAFTNFPGYAQVEKAAWNDFPKPGDNPVDSRLLAQERLGKIVGDEERLGDIEKLELETIAGLQYSEKRLQVRAGKRVALTIRNVDPSMPHNWVLVQPGATERIGLGSMKLAADPKGMRQHYVVQDDAVLAMSPILQPGNRYVVYFNAPNAPGEYPYVCTFPGHWQVMQGVLEVVP